MCEYFWLQSPSRVTPKHRDLDLKMRIDAQGLGNPKDVQTHLRHSDIGTTLNEYTQAVPESVRKLVNAVADDVMASKISTMTPVTKEIQ